MDQRDSHCPYLLSSETTAKGTGLAESAGKEDPRSFMGSKVTILVELCAAVGHNRQDNLVRGSLQDLRSHGNPVASSVKWTVVTRGKVSVELSLCLRYMLNPSERVFEYKAPTG